MAVGEEKRLISRELVGTGGRGGGGKGRGKWMRDQKGKGGGVGGKGAGKIHRRMGGRDTTE